MKNLLIKEFKLALHPTAILFWLLSAMLLIPNYPYYVVFFYTALGIFFISLTGRENHDIFYSMTLPIRKKDIVNARFLFVIIIEMIQVLIAIPFAILRQSLQMPPNQAGMDANITLFGLSLVMLGLFNLVFLVRYYKNPNKVGGAFNISCVAVFLFVAIAETCAHAVPYVRDVLDTYDNVYVPQKLVVLAIGIVVYALLTLIAYKKSVKSFEALDL